MQGTFSYGPCQFPTLGFIIERHKKIEEFVEEEFWSIQCEFEGQDPDKPAGQGTMTCSFNWDRVRLYHRAMSVILYESCFDENGIATAKVTDIRAKGTSHRRPEPLNTVELQKRA